MSTMKCTAAGDSMVLRRLPGDYPGFSEMVEFIRQGDVRFVNMETTIHNHETYASALSGGTWFCSPPEVLEDTKAMGFNALTTCNNHALDYGFEGRSATMEALKEAGVSYGAREQSFLYTTESGLTIGVYCDDFAFDRAHIADSIASLRERGAEIVVCAFHWGEEQVYEPAQNEIDWGHIAIDAGADIVAGHHPHVLQPVEYYKNGVIFYSLGNFSFGGNANPTDTDSVILQQEVFRGPDGMVNLGTLNVIPVSITSTPGRNDYQPMPLEEGTDAYNRVMEKLFGAPEE